MVLLIVSLHRSPMGYGPTSFYLRDTTAILENIAALSHIETSAFTHMHACTGTRRRCSKTLQHQSASFSIASHRDTSLARPRS